MLPGKRSRKSSRRILPISHGAKARLIFLNSSILRGGLLPKLKRVSMKNEWGKSLTREEIDNLIELASDIGNMVNEIEHNLYSSSDPIDENASSLRMYAMNQLMDN